MLDNIRWSDTTVSLVLWKSESTNGTTNIQTREATEKLVSTLSQLGIIPAFKPLGHGRRQNYFMILAVKYAQIYIYWGESRHCTTTARCITIKHTTLFILSSYHNCW